MNAAQEQRTAVWLATYATTFAHLVEETCRDRIERGVVTPRAEIAQQYAKKFAEVASGVADAAIQHLRYHVPEEP